MNACTIKSRNANECVNLLFFSGQAIGTNCVDLFIVLKSWHNSSVNYWINDILSSL